MFSRIKELEAGLCNQYWLTLENLTLGRKKRKRNCVEILVVIFILGGDRVDVYNKNLNQLGVRDQCDLMRKALLNLAHA